MDINNLIENLDLQDKCKYPIFHTGYKLNFKYADFV